MKIYLCVLATVAVAIFGWTAFLNAAAHVMQTRSNVRWESVQEAEILRRLIIPAPSPVPSPTDQALRF